LRTGFSEDFLRRKILGSSGQYRRGEKGRCINRGIAQSDMFAANHPKATAFNVQSSCASRQDNGDPPELMGSQ
jgi:hypothetical protein